MDMIAKRKPSMWRYREAIPVNNDANIVSLDEGFTPLIPVDFFGRKVLVKDDRHFPTRSFKDRGASVLISVIKGLGIKHVIEDSSGNAGAAIAAYCAEAKIKCDIYIPESTSQFKIDKIEKYGADLIKIPGSREDAADAAMRAAKTCYFASHVWNPFFFHGTKTFAFEIWEQLGFKAPDTVVVPAGNGTLLLGAHIGFSELLNAGMIDKAPKIIAVQSANCSPIYRAFKEDLDEVQAYTPTKTAAEGIAVARPARGKEILAAVRNTDGEILTVSETEILESHEKMKLEGFEIEVTSAAVTAGLSKYLSTCAQDECVVSIFTGHGG